VTDYKNHSGKIILTAKDIFIIILIVIAFSFIDLRAALFMGAVITSIILIRRAIKHLNPRHTNGYKILKEGNEISVPQRVEVFELSNSATMGILYKYVEVLRMMTVHPRILIIRFKRILRISPDEAHILGEVIICLSVEKIKIFFSDVDMNLEKQLKKYDLVQKVGEDNIFYTIDDALNRAEKTLNIH